MDISDKVYLELKPMERMRLALSAAARGDGLEIDRLVQTCGRKTYRLQDQDFEFPLKTFNLMATTHHGLVASTLVGAATVMMLMLTYSEDEIPVDADHPPLEQQYDRLRGIVKARLEAWAEFCRVDVGLSAPDALEYSPEREASSLRPLVDALDLGACEFNCGLRTAYLAALRREWGRATPLKAENFGAKRGDLTWQRPTTIVVFFRTG